MRIAYPRAFQGVFGLKGAPVLVLWPRGRGLTPLQRRPRHLAGDDEIGAVLGGLIGVVRHSGILPLQKTQNAAHMGQYQVAAPLPG